MRERVKMKFAESGSRIAEKARAATANSRSNRRQIGELSSESPSLCQANSGETFEANSPLRRGFELNRRIADLFINSANWKEVDCVNGNSS